MVLALFAFASSHPLLEGLGLIHHEISHADEADHSERNHEAADGICRFESSHEDIQNPFTETVDLSHSSDLLYPILLNTGPDPDADGGSLSPPPPELGPTWQFSSRAALPVRAPSFAS